MKWLLPWKWQSSCLLCHEHAEQPPLCTGCETDLAQLRPDSARICPLCALFSTDGTPCGRCQKHPPAYVALWASVYYDPPLRALIHAWKHQGQTAVIRILQHIMQTNPPPWLPECGADCIAAMPLSRARRLQRGFNQSEELAQTLAAAYTMPLLPYQSFFRKPGQPQSTLNFDSRRKNVRKTFRILKPEAVIGQTVLLIDDVCTSGATANEFARTLKRAGAAAVYVWVLARAGVVKSHGRTA